ncbi:acyl dehydratase [Rhodobacter aestuarii]|uniref:Acyl dehydratase n=1 Tax=Rhodobacter aestuarii TaxID=453582 RepID=A0A1N7K0G4_9RHOB|nr:MaoC/PaaZ C-terminal domain-containing protein [Rhodobacter aestuarii]PTV95911.1 acyl dehydratase [Rhodobacter aestuarii]SIS55057.1 Acyl dehydratase [Rhodobacter aestuarii]
MNLFFEDVEVGAHYVTDAHEITSADIADFCRLTRDHHPLHTDEAYAKAAGFGGIIAHGLYGLSLMEGLKTELKLYEETSIASLGWNNVRFVKPILAGDTVRVEMEFTAKRASASRPAGVITEAVRLMRGDEVVIDAEHISLIRQKG